MKHIYFVKSEGRHWFVMGGAGSYIDTQVIPEAVQYLKENNCEVLTVQGLNGVDVVLDENTTVQMAIKQWNEKSTEYYKQEEEKRKTYENSPEGQAEQRAKEEEEAKHNAFVYHSVDEALLALTKISPVDLKSDKTTQKEAVGFCKEILTVLVKCEDLRFNEEQQAEFSEILDKLGCATTKTVSKKFVENEEATIGEILNKKDNIEFPISALSQLIDTSSNTFSYGMAKIAEGGMEHSWAGSWLQAQDKEKVKDN